MAIYASVHATHKSDSATIKLWPSYGHARTDIHVWGNKLKNKGCTLRSKDIRDGDLYGLQFNFKGSVRYMSVFRIDTMEYDESKKLYELPSYVSYNTRTHHLQALGSYVDARLSIVDYATVTKEYNEYNWLDDGWHKTFKKGFDDLELLQDQKLDSVTVPVEGGHALYWNICRSGLFGTKINRMLMDSYRSKGSMDKFIQHDML